MDPAKRQSKLMLFEETATEKCRKPSQPLTMPRWPFPGLESCKKTISRSQILNGVNRPGPFALLEQAHWISTA